MIVAALAAVINKVWQNSFFFWNNTIDCIDFVLKEIKRLVKTRVSMIKHGLIRCNDISLF